MSDSAFTIARKQGTQTLSDEPANRRRKWLRALLWHLAPWVLPALLFALWNLGCERGWRRSAAQHGH
jgi:sulfonate transport system permease protein